MMTPINRASIIINRIDDINYRGENHLVYDSNSVCKLKEAIIQYDNLGNYISPKSYKLSKNNITCIIL